MGNSPSSSALPPLPDHNLDLTMEYVTSSLPPRAQRIVVLRDEHDAVSQVVCVWFDIASHTPRAKELCLDKDMMLRLHEDLKPGSIDGVVLHDRVHMRTMDTGIPGLRRTVQKCLNEDGSVSVAGTTEHLYDTIVRAQEAHVR